MTQEEILRKYQGNYGGGETEYDDALSIAAKSGNYRTLFNTQIANHNAAEISKKYLASSLARSGLGGTGYGTSQAIAINNNLANSNAAALEQYRQGNLEANQGAYDRAMASADDEVQGLALEIGRIDNTDGKYDYNTLLRNAGYVDEGGNYTDKWNTLTDNQRRVISDAIEISKNNYGVGANQTDDSSNSFSFGELANALVGSQNKPLAQVFEWEYNAIKTALQNDQLEANTYLKIQGHDRRGERSEPAYIMWDGENFVIVTEEQFNNAEKKKYAYDHKLYDTDQISEETVEKNRRQLG